MKQNEGGKEGRKEGGKRRGGGALFSQIQLSHVYDSDHAKREAGFTFTFIFGDLLANPSVSCQVLKFFVQLYRAHHLEI